MYKRVSMKSKPVMSKNPTKTYKLCCTQNEHKIKQVHQMTDIETCP